MADQQIVPIKPEAVLELIKTSHSALDVAKAKFDAVLAKEAACEQLIPRAVEALVQFDRIPAGSREKAAELLRDPQQALEILIRTADPGNSTSAGAVGKPAASIEKGAGDGDRLEHESPADATFRRKVTSLLSGAR